MSELPPTQTKCSKERRAGIDQAGGADTPAARNVPPYARYSWRGLLRLVSAPLSLVPNERGPTAADVVLVMGGPVNPDGTLPPHTEERVRVGVALWEQGRAPLLCFVGGHCPRGFENTEAERQGPSALALRCGVPAAAMRIDRVSRSTWENALQARMILGAEGARRVLVVTQPFHLRRACWLLRRQGFVPIPFVIADGVQEHLPAAVVLRWVFREYAAWLRLALRVGCAQSQRND